MSVKHTVRRRLKPVHIIGVPLDLGGSRRGVDMGPSAFRIAGLGERHRRARLTPSSTRATCRRRFPKRGSGATSGKKYIRDIAKVCQKLYQTAARVARRGRDAARARRRSQPRAPARWRRPPTGRRTTRELPIGLIWIDAHGDMNTPATSPSGNVHGMPLAALLGPEPAELARIGGFSPKVLPAHTVLIGVRNLDEREKVAVRDSRVHVFTMKDIDRQGIASVVEQAREPRRQRHGRHSRVVRLDVCDPAIAPGVGTPVKGGLDYREAHMVMEIVADSGLLTSLDLVEVNPTLDVRNTTAQLGAELALSALGMKIL